MDHTFPFGDTDVKLLSRGLILNYTHSKVCIYEHYHQLQLAGKYNQYH